MYRHALRLGLIAALALVGILACASAALAAGPAVRLTQYFSVTDTGVSVWKDNLTTASPTGYTRIAAYDANGTPATVDNVKVLMIGPWSHTFAPGHVAGQRTITEHFDNVGPTATAWVTGNYTIVAWVDANGNNAIDAGELTANIKTLRLVNVPPLD